jgi:RNA polymerase sigma-70 factor (ECF subfamily)
MSDAELVRQARAGRAEAYAELVRRWAARVTAVCHARVGRAGAADDLAQEALLRGFRSLGTLADPGRFGPWLCGIALRACLDWLKAKQNAQVPFSALGPGRHPDDYPGGRPGPADAAEREDDLRQLMTEVEALPEDCRRVVLLYYYEDLTYRDLARLLGVSPATVNARLTRARALLRARLSGCRR